MSENILEQDRQLILTYQKWAKASCAPIFWRGEDYRIHNGTITFAKTTESKILGITNAHVADAIVNCKDELGGCRIGNAYLDHSRLIAKHPNKDLATFDLSGVILATASANDEESIATEISIPSTAIAEGDIVALGGYPSIYIEEDRGNNNISFKFAWFAAKVESAHDKHAGLQLRLLESWTISNERIPPNANLGGMSGGAVFRVIDANLIERLELAGIIYEYSPESELMFAHQLTELAVDGNFIEQFL